jgi:hypothetical protein
MTYFQHVTDIGEKSSIASLEDNIKSFLDWGFLNIGGFINVKIPTSGISGGDFHKLKPATDLSSTANTIWSSPKKDWVYESGISHKGNSPTSISGIYLNNTFVPGPTGVSPNQYRINYPLGQIVFTSAKPANSNIQLNYSYRYVQVYKANESVWWKEIQDLAYNPKNNNADLNITANHRIQLPSIIIETIARTSQTPYQLGTTENIISQDILLHIFTENPMQRNTLIDILLLQKDKQSFLYDINKVIKNNTYGLNYRGEKNNSGLNYNQIINDQSYHLRSFYIDSAVTSEMNTLSSSLYNAIVRWSIKIYP